VKINNTILAVSSVATDNGDKPHAYDFDREGKTVTDFQTQNTNAACISGAGYKSAKRAIISNPTVSPLAEIDSEVRQVRQELLHSRTKVTVI
jgi:hypothetical protein